MTLITTSEPKRSYRPSVWVFLIYIFVSLVFMSVYIATSKFNGNNKAPFVSLIEGKAAKPYVSRVLTPQSIRLIARLIPASVKERFNRSLLGIPAVRSLVRKIKWEPAYLSYYAIASVFMYLSLLGFMFALRYLFITLFEASLNFVNLVPVLGTIGLAPLMNIKYIYDLPTLFLFTLGLMFMARGKWRLFLATFFIGCLNRETMILLTMVFVIYFGIGRRQERGQFLRLLLYQTLIYGIVRLILGIIFRNNPGSFFEFHFFDHNWLLLTHWFDAHIYPTGFLAIVIILLLFLYHWSEQPDFIKSGVWILVPLVGLTLFIGWVDEYRVYLEVYPILLLMLVNNSAKIIGIPIQVKKIESA
jgi:hypothetical protein